MKRSFFVFSSTQKILSHKILEIGSRPRPLPSAICADSEVKIRIEAEFRQQIVAASVSAVYKFAVIKMANPPHYITDLSTYGSVVRPSPH
jgi:hypothetical protein